LVWITSMIQTAINDTDKPANRSGIGEGNDQSAS